MIKKHLLSANTIAISGHTNPDGDSIGALLSLGLGLEQLGKQVYMICSDEIPRKYSTLPGIDKVVKTNDFSVDLAIAVDCGSKEMIGPAFRVFENAEYILEIDHHQSRAPFGDIEFVDAAVSSAGELVYILLCELDVTITTDIAQNIMTSILVETNSFRLPGILFHTFEVCADLLQVGVDFYKLAETVYWVTSKETALLSGACLNRCRFLDDNQLAWSYISRKDLARFDACDFDADPVIEKIRSIQGVKIAILFREKDKKSLRVSFRSKKGLNVAALAELFGGGGHMSAAGCTILRKKKLQKKIITLARELVKRHNQECYSDQFRISLPDLPERLSQDILDEPLNDFPISLISRINDERTNRWKKENDLTTHIPYPKRTIDSISE